MEVVAGINGIFAIVEVCIASAFFRTATRPMLYHSIDTEHTPTSIIVLARLESVAIGTSHIYSQICILAKCSVYTAPTWFACNVYLWR